MKITTKIASLVAMTAMLAWSQPMTACTHQAPLKPTELNGENVVPMPAITQPQADTVTVHSDKMNRDIKNVVIVPQQYFTQPERRFPVLYLLHGAYGSYDNWSHKANLDSLSTHYEVIIVCPDGQDSWYWDSPIDPTMQFETYVSHELLGYVDQHYRTIADAPHRAITGLSMGGHGALWLAFRHPDLYGSCGSMSGGVDITHFPDKWKMDKRIGPYATNKERWAEYTVINLVPTLKPGLNIIIDDGTGDIFYKENLALHEALLSRGIDHDFTIRPGKHTWTYWVNSLDYHLLFFSKAFKQAATAKK